MMNKYCATKDMDPWLLASMVCIIAMCLWFSCSRARLWNNGGNPVRQFIHGMFMEEPDVYPRTSDSPAW